VQVANQACRALDKKLKGSEDDPSPISLEDFLVLLQENKGVMTHLSIFQQLLSGKKIASKPVKPTLDKSSWIRLAAERQVLFGDKNFHKAIGVKIESMQLLSFLPPILKGFHFPVAVPVAAKYFPMEKSHGVHNLKKSEASFKEGASLNRHATQNTSTRGLDDARNFKDDWMKDSSDKEKEIHDLKERISDKHSHSSSRKSEHGSPQRSHHKHSSSKVHAGNEDS